MSGAALSKGHTFIITNAMNGWVEYSSAKWVRVALMSLRYPGFGSHAERTDRLEVPDLLPVLQKVRVISARGSDTWAWADMPATLA